MFHLYLTNLPDLWHSNCFRRHKALRTTAIQGMNGAVYEIRHIMHMSVRPLLEVLTDCSTIPKKNMIDKLTRATFLRAFLNCGPEPRPVSLSHAISCSHFRFIIKSWSSFHSILKLSFSRIHDKLHFQYLRFLFKKNQFHSHTLSINTSKMYAIHCSCSSAVAKHIHAFVTVFL